MSRSSPTCTCSWTRPPTTRDAARVHGLRLPLCSWPGAARMAAQDRRKLLDDELDGSPILPARRLPEDGLEAWRVVQERGYEELVAKDGMAPYRPSTRW